MRVLALDTTTRAGSVAIVEDDRIVEERSGDGSRTHAERLPREIIDVVEARGLGWNDIDFYAVASGPGSFTGLRIGIATIQGLAFVHGRKVVGVSALDALAQAASQALDAGAVVSSWMDAHRREVFSASYRVRAAPIDTADRLEPLDGPRVESPAEALDRLTGALVTPNVFVGDGAALYATEIARTFGGASVRTAPLIAGIIGRLAIVRAWRGEVLDPAGLQPLYVRRPDAEIARDQRNESSG